jgi:hypothetical protein
MNVLLWVLQVALALLYLAGGAYKTFMFDELANEMWYSVLPRGGWAALGVFEMVCGVLLVVPAAAKWMPVLTPLAAATLALETLALAGLYARYSLTVTVTNPLVWAATMGLLVAFVALTRRSCQRRAAATARHPLVRLRRAVAYERDALRPPA